MLSTFARDVLAAAALVASVGLIAPGTLRAQEPEGIKVHGRWTIDVRNADGTLASRHEFDNALVITGGDATSPGGNSFLAGLLGKHYRQIHSWQIFLFTDIGGLCDGSSVLSCTITEQLGPEPAGMGQLSVHVPRFTGFPGEFPTGTVELRGMTRAVRAGSVTHVATAVNVCRLSDCSDASRGINFTRHPMTSAITVTANQVVQVTVVFSFS